MRPATLVIALSAVIGAAIHAQQPPSPAATGVITGTVLDESGRPVVGARVQAIIRAKRWAGPYYETAAGRPDESDDRGQFRLHSLPPGPYVVAVFEEPRQPPTPPREGPGHVRTYNPGTTSLEEAAAVEVRAAEEQSVSVRYVLVPFVSVSGVVTTSDGLPAMNFTVWLRGGPATIGYTGIRRGYMTTQIAGTTTAKDGSFTLSRVPAGSYALMASNGFSGRRSGQAPEVGEMPLEVASASVAGLKVGTAPGATVSGRLEWAGTGPIPWPRDRTLGRLRALGLGLTSDFATIDSEVQPDGTFRFANLYGLRRIQEMSLPFNWAIQSIGGPEEILAGQNIRITPGVDVTDLRVVVTNRTTTMMATLADVNDKPYAKGSLLLMPTDPADLDPLGWGFRVTPGGALNNGVPLWRVDRLLPGSYYAVVIDVEPYRLTGDTDLMERARAAAVRVDIREGASQADVRVPVVRLRPFVRTLSN